MHMYNNSNESVHVVSLNWKEDKAETCFKCSLQSEDLSSFYNAALRKNA